MMIGPRQLLPAILLLLTSLSALGGEATLPTTNDWSGVSELASQDNRPVLIVFTSESCGYCERLKREVIGPMLEKGRDGKSPVILTYDIDKGGKVTDFDGSPIRSRIFTRRYKVFATPTVVILDANGNPLVNPIVGYNSREKYSQLLDNALHEAYSAIQTIDLPPKALAKAH